MPAPMAPCDAASNGATFCPSSGYLLTCNGQYWLTGAETCQDQRHVSGAVAFRLAPDHSEADPPQGDPMFDPAAFTFLTDLAANNTRDWFTPRKADYIRLLKAPFAHVLYGVTERLRDTALPLSGGDDTMFRINRDVRFSNDKTPYQTHVSGLLTRDGAKVRDGAIVYVHLDAQGGFCVGGVYMPPPPRLAAIRDRIARQQDAFLSITGTLKSKGFSLDKTQSLVRMPKGFEGQADTPVADYLRLKSFYTERAIAPKAWLDGSVMDIVADHALTCAPLLAFLDD